MNTKRRCSSRIINSLLRRGGTFVVLASVLVLFPMIAYGAAVDLAWDANTEPDLAGYKIHYGTARGDYSHTIDVGNITTYTLTDLEEGVTYYLAATAYDEDENESDYSDELVHTCINEKPINQNPTTPSIPSGPSTGYSQTSYNFSTTASDPNGDELQYRFDWGDGESSDWGASSQSHSWSSANIFCIKAQAQDSKGALSAWSDCRNITTTENTHTITASAGANGSITPSGSVTINHGSDRTFAISAGTNYHVQDVLVNGESVGAVTSYTFTNVTQNHTIQASFAINTHTITAIAGANGSISPSGIVTVNHGSSWMFTINAAVNYHVQDVLVNGESVGAVTSYRFTNVTQKHTIQASFAIDTHTITASAGKGGSISPADSVTVNHGSDQAFTLTPAENYHIVDISVDGTLVGVAPNLYRVALAYLFNNVSNNHSIHVIFAADNQPPVADAGADRAVYVNDTVQLDGGGSSDADGDSLTFNWSIVSIPGGSKAALSDTQAMKPVIDIDVSGTYRVQLIVNDGTASSAPDTVTISTENSAPMSHAGADQTVLVDDAVQLDGSDSSDVDGDTLTFEWSFVSRPDGSSATLSDTTVVKPVFDVDVFGTYTVQLIVNDGTASSAPDTVTISTENSAPVSHAGADQTVLVDDTVQLNGSDSSDVDGDTLTYEWSFVSRPDGSSAALSDTTVVKPVFDVDVSGTYTVQLIVNDGTASSAPDTVTISTENSAPVSHAGADQAVLVNDTVQLDGSASSDVDGDTLTFKWSFVSKPDGSSATLSGTTVVKPVFDVDVSGTYTVQLIVNDGTASSAPDTVTISTENSAPVSHAGADQTVLVDDTVQLDGSDSSDADGDTLTFKWSFISKPGGSIAVLSSKTTDKPTFKVDDAGTYIVQLIVNDGTDSSTPDTVTIITGNSAPVSNAGNDQTVQEGETVTLSGFNSTDPDDNIASYTWRQTDGKSVVLSNSKGAETTFTAPSAVTDADTLTFRLTVIDTKGLEDVDDCIVTVTRAAVVDSDGDGVPDDQDDFPLDPDEYLDSDGDGLGNNADTDDDNDGMPDDWELMYGLDPLKDDAAEDPDEDGVFNIDEYNLGSEPNKKEGNTEPSPPALITPDNHEIVNLTPELKTDEYYDPDIDDVHSQTQWEIIRAEDEYIVFDVMTDSSLTAMTVPKMILDYDTDYIWRVRFIDNHSAASGWSEAGYFRTEFSQQDSDGNGILDHQEVGDTLDLDNDGVPDREQSDIKCIVANSGNAQIGVSIRDAENVDSILSLEIEETENANLVSNSKGKPRFIDFGLLHFKLLLNAPGEETVVTLHLSEAPFGKGKKNKRERVKMYKYDPVNTEWLDYSEYAEFSRDRKKVYLTLKDGGFGDADGIENGIIVDPLAFGSDSDSNSSSGSGSDDSLIPDNMSCFIAAASSDAGNMQPLCNWHEVGTRDLSIVFILMVLGYVGTEIFLRLRQKRGDEAKRIGRIAM